VRQPEEVWFYFKGVLWVLKDLKGENCKLREFIEFGIF
jgi:hypothetical protein